MKKTMKNVGIVVTTIIITLAIMWIGLFCYDRAMDVMEDSVGVNELHWDCSREEFSGRVIDVISAMDEVHQSVELVDYHWLDTETHGVIEMKLDNLIHTSFYVFE